MRHGTAQQQLVIANRVEEIPRMSAWLDAAMCQLGVDAALRFRFDLCANEAVTNIISYAYADAGAHAISLRLGTGDGSVQLSIVDDGIAFNPLTLPERVPPHSLEEAQIGGLGVELMRKLMDTCRYERRDERNVLTLIAGNPAVAD